jgi:hypothetical protein
MASEATATGSSSATENMTPAQLLEHQHALNPTIEEVPDEEDLAHPPPKSDAAPPPVLSEKAAGKQKAEDPAPAKKPSVPFNTASEELFPALGPVKPRAAAPVPTWGKKPASVTTSNGVNGSLAPSNDTSRSSTPASGVGIPAALPLVRGPALPTMSLPGKHSERISFHPSQLLPRSQMKKPMNEMIRELNKKSKAKLEHKAGAGGLQFFEATGPVEAVRQILKDAANEVGSKVRPADCGEMRDFCCPALMTRTKLTLYSNPSRSLFPHPSARLSSVVKVPRSRKSASAPVPVSRCRNRSLEKTRTL